MKIPLPPLTPRPLRCTCGRVLRWMDSDLCPACRRWAVRRA